MNYAPACTLDFTNRAETIDSPVSELSDDELMARVHQRDEQAFACLLGRHLDSLHGYIFRVTGSTADADDLAQETFLRVWLKAHTFKSGTVKLTTWLHRIAHNLCVDEFRRRPRATSDGLEQITDPGADQATWQARREDVARLPAALDELPESQRSALVLCQIQGFTNQEAAAIVNVSVRALESLLARARRTLKSKLSERASHE
jgi:RNA polymerase sigma-70 factor (ECF subfamily)